MKSAVDKIIFALLHIADDKVIVRGSLGSGSRAREMSNKTSFQKIVLLGDTAGVAKQMLFCLLWDLSVDVGLGDSVCDALSKEFRQSDTEVV